MGPKAYASARINAQRPARKIYMRLGGFMQTRTPLAFAERMFCHVSNIARPLFAAPLSFFLHSARRSHPRAPQSHTALYKAQHRCKPHFKASASATNADCTTPNVIPAVYTTWWEPSGRHAKI
eukprot:7734227-Pyramimonas_sp.AAC.1